jgi:hypothetical protein
MPSDREKLLGVMSSLEDDYRSGKISAEKYSYFRSKYEDKLNSIDAQEATRRIRSMQGKPSSNVKSNKKRKKPSRDKEEKEDLVQKYIINPKKDDAKYNKNKKSSIDSGTFKLLLVLVLVLGFTVGVGYGVFNLDFDTVSDTTPVAIVQDTAFPDITQNTVANNTNNSYYSVNSDKDSSSNSNVETTTDNSYSDSSYQSSSDSVSQSSSQSSSDSTSQSSSDSGSQSDSQSSSDSSSDSGSQSSSDSGSSSESEGSEG